MVAGSPFWALSTFSTAAAEVIVACKHRMVSAHSQVINIVQASTWPLKGIYHVPQPSLQTEILDLRTLNSQAIGISQFITPLQLGNLNKALQRK